MALKLFNFETRGHYTLLMARLAMNLNGFTGKPEKNSRHLAVPPLVSLRNDV